MVGPTVLPPGGENAIAVTLGLIGDEWTLSILRHALRGVTRYQDWRDRLPISDAVLSARLTTMTGAGLLTRTAYQARPPRHEYELTERGHELWPVLVAILAWESRWVDDHTEPLRHSSCGHPMEPVLTCAGCDKPVAPRDVSSELGPSGAAARSIPSGTTRRRSVTGTGAETMALIGNRWSVGLLGAALLGAHRFGEFQQRLGAPPAMVADRLRIFCSLGVLEAGAGGYHLTAKGRAFFPVVMTAIAWGQRWFRAPEGDALISKHRSCGGAFAPRLVCDSCGAPLREPDLSVVAEPRSFTTPTR
jgi:DNA-binding HxlR family transcriptional regulator